ncbi:MAG TPA: nitroreductase family protein [Salinivirgaceae bacterium]|nr:nitroreductase family protein [Salinivirgaceae bacterium]
MKSLIKKIFKNILRQQQYERVLNVRKKLILKKDYSKDYKLYKKNSSVFTKNNFEKKESEVTLRYHALEKGFLHNSIRPRFAKKHVVDLLSMIRDSEILKNKNRVQIQSAIVSLLNYYELHKELSADISDYFNLTDYEFLKKHLIKQMSSVQLHTISDYFLKNYDDFLIFSNSRCSVRSFTGEKISADTIQKVINLANNAPSVCNRQSVSVILLENKTLIDKILEIQGGMTGYSEKVNQLMVVLSNRNYFYSIGERNQLYIDGGIYLMNLLYALHYYKIGACPAHWGMPTKADEKTRDLLNLSDAYQIISLVVIGIPTDNFKTTLSLRKTHEENLMIIK